MTRDAREHRIRIHPPTRILRRSKDTAWTAQCNVPKFFRICAALQTLSTLPHSLVPLLSLYRCKESVGSVFAGYHLTRAPVEEKAAAPPQPNLQKVQLTRLQLLLEGAGGSGGHPGRHAGRLSQGEHGQCWRPRRNVESLLLFQHSAVGVQRRL